MIGHRSDLDMITLIVQGFVLPDLSSHGTYLVDDAFEDRVFHHSVVREPLAILGCVGVAIGIGQGL